MNTKDNIIKGKWIVHYDPAKFEYRDILEFLLNSPGLVKEENLDKGYNEIVFDKNSRENYHFLKERGVYPGLKEQNLENVLLYFPFLISDKRWQTINLTASAIFLGSALTNEGFNVKVKKLQLPAGNIAAAASAYDLIGFTLFEELLPEFKEFIESFPPPPGQMLAAGGPLVTLNPMQAAYHLAKINLLVRGEAELILPGILKTLQENNLPGLTGYRGLLFQIPGLIVISDLSEINRPGDFKDFQFNLDFLAREHLENGLEINFSRGCRRGCLFCSKVQGKELRKLPLEKADDLLAKFSAAIERSVLPVEETKFARCVNINDDDILQDTNYARQVLGLIKKQQFKCWGIQAAPVSFLDKEQKIRREVIEIFRDRDVFVNNRPLVWLGTDSFLEVRGRRLGKVIPTFAVSENLVREFEKRDILNYHYWICSDFASTWAEFAREFLFIYKLLEKFKTFSIIAHSPFLVPYSSTPLYRLLIKSEVLKEKIRYKTVLKSREDKLTLPLPQRVETGFAELNKLLNNESLDHRPGFFACLKQKDYLNAFINLYNFLKQERIHYESLKDQKQAESLVKTEKEIEFQISKLI